MQKFLQVVKSKVAHVQITDQTTYVPEDILKTYPVSISDEMNTFLLPMWGSSVYLQKVLLGKQLQDGDKVRAKP